MLVQPANFPNSTKKYLCFETLTFAPFDRRLLLPDLLTRAERDWLDSYHRRVNDLVGPQLTADERAWLSAACAPIDG